MRKLFTLALACAASLFCHAALAAWPCMTASLGNGTGSKAVFVSTDKAVAFGWVCLVDNAPTASHWILLDSYRPKLGDCTPSTSEMMRAIEASPDSLAAANDVLSRCSWVPAAGTADAAAWTEVRDKVQTLALSQWAIDHPTAATSPAPSYVVKPNASSTKALPDRPAYSLANGVRGSKELGRALVGQPCTTALPTLASTGTDLWASFGPAPTAGVVALCNKKEN